MPEPIFKFDGALFGYRTENLVWNLQGEKIGQIFANEIYSGAGKYTGDLVRDRVCHNRRKTFWVRQGFSPRHRSVPFRHIQRVSRLPLPLGYKNVDGEQP